MTESAELARRLGLTLHTHLAETIEEEAYCMELYGATPVEYLTDLGWLGLRRLVRALRPSLRRRHRRLRRLGYRRRPLPDLEPPPRSGRRSGSRLPRRGHSRRPRRRRVGVERAQRPPARDEAGAPRRARTRRAECDDRPRGSPARHAWRRSGAREGRPRLARAGEPGRLRGLEHERSRARGRRRPRRRARLSAPHRVDRLVVEGEDVVRGGALVKADEDEIARAHRDQARRFAQ